MKINCFKDQQKFIFVVVLFVLFRWHACCHSQASSRWKRRGERLVWSFVENGDYRGPGAADWHADHQTLPAGGYTWRSVSVFVCVQKSYNNLDGWDGWTVVHSKQKCRETTLWQHRIPTNLSELGSRQNENAALKTNKLKVRNTMKACVPSLRLLWWGFECHHRVCGLLPPRQQLWRLHLHHGESVSVGLFLWFLQNYVCFISRGNITVPYAQFTRSVSQVRGEQPGAAGGWRLHDRLPERSNTSQEDAWNKLAEEMLPDDWQKVNRTTVDFWQSSGNEKEGNIYLFRQVLQVLLIVFWCFCRLRKNLKCLIIVHPTWFIRTVLAISRPFIR